MHWKAEIMSQDVGRCFNFVRLAEKQYQNLYRRYRLIAWDASIFLSSVSFRRFHDNIVKAALPTGLHSTWT